MEIVLIVIVIGLYILEFIEKKKLQKKIDDLNEKNLKPKPQLTEEEKQKQEKMQKSFNNLMEYDYDTALKGKKE